MKYSAVVCLLVACFAVGINNGFRIEENLVRERRQAACYTPVIQADVPYKPILSTGMPIFTQAICSNGFNLFLNCSGDGSDVTSVAFMGVNIDNATFTYFEDDTQVFTETIRNGGFGMPFVSNVVTTVDGPSTITRIEVTVDLFSEIPFECFAVGIVQVVSCCPAQGGCPPGLAGFFCRFSEG